MALSSDFISGRVSIMERQVERLHSILRIMSLTLWDGDEDDETIFMQGLVRHGFDELEDMKKEVVSLKETANTLRQSEQAAKGGQK